ncbi:membrane protein [Streptomyces sp. AS58]|uniref:DoxX family protein n=1 Tax=Streptomyces cadmiisoli TaxID=2184053 RepID=A0A2Z4IT36_9ACTN|nr:MULTISPECIES: DoxX family protein [Streptomyces]AWW35914.1 DoxX family protein [Streptomyces cadmiisoli]KOV69892.1 membrane protein [Streptomyces sp. AS58]
MSAGLLLLRLLLAALLFGHAAQKLLGWFRGLGPDGTAAVFESWGFRPGRPMVLLAGTCELVGAVLLGAGAVTPLAAAVVMGTMIVAAAPSAANGLWAHLGGCEVPFLYGSLALVVAVTGPGNWSVDHAVGADDFSGVPWAVAAAVLAAVSAVPPLLLRRRNLRGAGEDVEAGRVGP